MVKPSSIVYDCTNNQVEVKIIVTISHSPIVCVNRLNAGDTFGYVWYCKKNSYNSPHKQIRKAKYGVPSLSKAFVIKAVADVEETCSSEL